MKIKNIKLCALIVAILIIISSLPLFASAASPTVYNWGIRDAVCPDLSSSAVAY